MQEMACVELPPCLFEDQAFANRHMADAMARAITVALKKAAGTGVWAAEMG